MANSPSKHPAPSKATRSTPIQSRTLKLPFPGIDVDVATDPAPSPPEPMLRWMQQLVLVGMFEWGSGAPLAPQLRTVVRPKRYRH